jgi:colicin import membrane protein
MNALSIRPITGISNRQVVKSVFFHLAIVFFFTVNAYLFPDENINFENAIRVDIVGLPEKLKKLPEPAKSKELAKPEVQKTELTPAKPEEVAKPAPVPVPDKKAIDLERKKAQQKAVEKLEAMESLKAMEEEDEKEKADAKKTAVAGNVANSGNALTGILQNQISSYIGQVKDHVNNNWNLPQWMANANLKAQALVMIDARGVVIHRSIVKTSGNSGFDDSILSAIDRSSPFPAPPNALVGVFKNKGFTLGFPE